MTQQAFADPAAPIEAGSNLLGNASAANWMFALPALRCDVLLFVGKPSCDELETLADIADHVVIWMKPGQVARFQKELDRQNLSNVSICRSEAETRRTLPPEGADVIRVKPARLARQLLSRPSTLESLTQFLSSNGVLYAEAHLTGKMLTDYLQENSASSYKIVPLWISPVSGNALHFSPLHDQSVADRLLRHGGFAPTFAGRISQRLHWWILNHHHVRRRFTRTGIVIGRRQSDLNTGPPAYLRDVARDSGIELDHLHWGMWAGGRYLSKKILFFLYEDPEQSPTYVVKMPRKSTLNARLDRACQAMRTLQEKDVFPTGTVPEVSFTGHHHGLTILGESVIEGEPFESYAAGDSSGYFLKCVLAHFQRLGESTRNDSSESIEQTLNWLEGVHRQFIELYQPEPEIQIFLDQQLQTLRGRSASLPLVFQHGDPGTWNLLVRDGREISILDWEAAEPHGLPLWDAFYFIQTYAQVTGEKSSSSDPVSKFQAGLLDAPETGDWTIRAVDQYCQEVGLDRALIAPLFFTCWMHRAVKEATRLSSERLQAGHYYRLLKLCIGQRNHGLLQRLFSADYSRVVGVEG